MKGRARNHLQKKRTKHTLARRETKTNLRKKNPVNQTIGHKRTRMRFRDTINTTKTLQHCKRELKRAHDHEERRDTPA